MGVGGRRGWRWASRACLASSASASGPTESASSSCAMLSGDCQRVQTNVRGDGAAQQTAMARWRWCGGVARRVLRAHGRRDRRRARLGGERGAQCTARRAACTDWCCAALRPPLRSAWGGASERARERESFAGDPGARPVGRTPVLVVSCSTHWLAPEDQLPLHAPRGARPDPQERACVRACARTKAHGARWAGGATGPAHTESAESKERRRRSRSPGSVTTVL